MDDEELSFDERLANLPPEEDLSDADKKKAELLKLAATPAPSQLTQDDPASFEQRWGPAASLPATVQPAAPQIEPEMKFADRWGAVLPPADEGPPGLSRGVTLPQAGNVDTPLERITSIVKLFTGLPQADTPQPGGSPQVAEQVPIEAMQRAVSSIESGSPEGDYGRIGPFTLSHRARDRAYGRYQVMGRNIGKWTEKWYGERLSPAQFLKNREAQDIVFQGEFGSYVKKYGSPSAAAAVWFGGPGGLANPDRTDRTPTTKGIKISEYVKRFDANIGREQGAPDASQALQPSGQEGVPPGPLAYLTQRGGHNTGAAPPVNPEFAARLTAAGQAYEAETGRKAYFGEMARDRATQARYYNAFKRGTGGLAAPPGHSRHEGGEGVDIRRGDFRDWLAEGGNAKRFGITPLSGRAYRADPVHFQMDRNANPNFLAKLKGVVAQLNPVSSASAEETVGAPPDTSPGQPGAPTRITVRPLGSNIPEEALPPGPPGSVSHTDYEMVPVPGHEVLPEITVTDEEPPAPSPAGPPPSRPVSPLPGRRPANLPTAEAQELASLASFPEPQPLSDPGALHTAIMTAPSAIKIASDFLGTPEPENFNIGERKQGVRLSTIISKLGDTWRGSLSEEGDVNAAENARRMMQVLGNSATGVFDYMAEHYSLPDLTKGENWTPEVGRRFGRAIDETLTGIGKGVAAGFLKLPSNIVQALVGGGLALTYDMTKHKGVGQLASAVIANTNNINHGIDNYIVGSSEGLASDIGELISLGTVVKGLVTRGLIVASPEFARILEDTPDIPTLDKIGDAIMGSANAQSITDVAATATSIPGTDGFVVNTPYGGPVYVKGKDLQTIGKMTFLMGGFLSAPALLKLAATELGHIPGMPRPLKGLPEYGNLVRTDATDLLHAHTLSTKAPLSNIYDRFYQEQKELNLQGQLRTTQQVADDLHIYSNSGMHNLVTSALKNGEMQSPTMSFKVDVPLQAMEDAANRQPQLKNYLRIKMQEDRLLHNHTVLQDAMNANVPPARMRELQDAHPTSIRDHNNNLIDIHSVRAGARRIEQAFPETVPFYNAWRDYIVEGQRFVSDGQHAAKDSHALNISTQHIPSTPIFTAEPAARLKVWKAVEGGQDPLVALEGQLEGAMYNRIQNEVKWNYVNGLPRGVQWVEVGVPGGLSEAEFARRSIPNTSVLKLQRQGVTHTFVGDSTTVDLLTLDQASFRNGMDLAASAKKYFQWATTGPLAPWFAPIAATRTWWQMMHTAPEWSSRPGPLAMMAEPFRLAMPGIAERTYAPVLEKWSNWFKGTTWGSIVPPQAIDAMVRGVTFEQARDFNRAFEISGGRNEGILRNVNYQRTQIAQGRQLSNNPGYQRMLSYFERTLRAPVQAYKAGAEVTGGIADSPNTAWARKNFYAKGPVPGFRSRTQRMEDPAQPGTIMHISKLAAEMRRLTGDPAERGVKFYQNQAGMARELSYQSAGRLNSIGESIARKAGTATEAWHSMIPWSGVLVRSPASTLTAMANRPFRTAFWMAYTQAMPEFLAYFWNRQQGPEYLDHMMEQRDDNKRDNYTYIAIPGRPPHEGFEMPMPQEGLLMRRSVGIMADQLFGRSPFTLQEEQADLLNSFLKTNLVPPIPSPVAAAMGYMGISAPGGLLGSPYLPRSREFRELNKQDNAIERVARALVPSLAHLWAQYYQASHAANGGTFDEIKSGAKAMLHAGGERTPYAREIIGLKPTLNAQTRNSEEMFKRKNIINQMAAFQKEADEAINTKGASGGGMELLKKQMPDLMLPQGSMPKPGLPQPPPRNPIYLLAMDLIHQKFKIDVPTRGGGGFPSMFRMYGQYGAAIDSMRNVNDGNDAVWRASQDRWTPEMLAAMKEAKVDTNNFRDVRNFYINKRNQLSTRIFHYIKEAEKDITNMPGMKQLLGGKPFTLEMVDPYKDGLQAPSEE